MLKVFCRKYSCLPQCELKLEFCDRVQVGDSGDLARKGLCCCATLFYEAEIGWSLDPLSTVITWQMAKHGITINRYLGNFSVALSSVRLFFHTLSLPAS